MSLVFARASTKEEDSAFYCSVCSGWFVASEHRLVEEPDQPQEAPKQHVPTPRQIFAGLEEHAIGQRSVKMALSVAVHNHYQRLAVARAQIKQCARTLARRRGGGAVGGSGTPPRTPNDLEGGSPGSPSRNGRAPRLRRIVEGGRRGGQAIE